MKLSLIHIFSYRSLIRLRDLLGSVRAVVDGDTGTVIEANDYYPCLLYTSGHRR